MASKRGLQEETMLMTPSILLVLFYWFCSTSSFLLVQLYWFYSIGSIGISNEIKKESKRPCYP